MSIETWLENVLLVELPGEPETREELEGVVCLARDQGECDVVVDFSDVTILTSTSQALLLRLRQLLSSHGRRVVLCGVGHTTRGVLSVTGLDGFFTIVDDRCDALASLEPLTISSTSTERAMGSSTV